MESIAKTNKTPTSDTHIRGEEKERLPWIKDKIYAVDFEVVEGKYDEYRDWVMDPKGYFLIRLNKASSTIELAHCANNHVITKMITGKTAQELYMTAIKLGLLSRLDHAAYLGKELKKAEFCLKNNLEYVQE